VDTAAHAVVGTIPAAGVHSNFITLNANSTLAYVNIEATNSVQVFNISNPTSPALVATITGFNDPIQVGVNPNGKFIYVPNLVDNSLSIVSTVPNSIVQTIPVGTNPAAVTVNPTGTFAYVANIGGTVSVIDLSTNTVVSTVAVSTGARGIS